MPLPSHDHPHTGDSVSRRIAAELERAERSRKRVFVGSMVAIAVSLGVIGTAVAAVLPQPGSRAVASTLTPIDPAPASAAALAPSGPADAASTLTSEGPTADPRLRRRAIPKRPTAAPKARSAAPTKSKPTDNEPPAAPAQRFSIAIGGAGYEPSTIRASSAAPIVLTVGRGEGCAAGFNMPELGVSEDNSAGPVTVRLGKLGPGTYYYTCGMGMVSGTLIVT